VLRTFAACLCDGSGVRGFLLWVRDAGAFERRDDVRAYRAWFARRYACSGSAPDKKTATVRDVVSCTQPCLPAPPHSTCWCELLESGRAQFLLFEHPDAVVSATGAAQMREAALATGADVLYSDEDQIGADGHHSPRFKPGFSIDLLRNEDYVGPVFLARLDRLRQLLASQPDGVHWSSHELLLRLYESGARIEHLSEVLVHWRRSRPTALDREAANAVERHLNRCYGTELGEALARDQGPPGEALVSIVIPTRDRLELLEPCIESIYASVGDVPFEVIVVDNDSRAPDTLRWLAAAPKRYADLHVVVAPYAFNWSKLCNQGAAEARGNCLVFLNNDVEVISERWLDRLATQALRPDVGAVGPMLLYPDGRIQHAGVVIGLGGFADHVYAGCEPSTTVEHRFVHPAVRRNVAAVTGACLVIAREKFERLGGFNEDLKICGDVALCVQLLRRKLLNVYCPDVRLYHHESATRLRAPLEPEEVCRGRQSFSDILEAGDPYYNARLGLQQRYPNIAS